MARAKTTNGECADSAAIPFLEQSWGSASPKGRFPYGEDESQPCQVAQRPRQGSLEEHAPWAESPEGQRGPRFTGPLESRGQSHFAWVDTHLVIILETCPPAVGLPARGSFSFKTQLLLLSASCVSQKDQQSQVGRGR